ncbi:unnamed protein product [Trichobilharzia regenti]|nr:unnamed protein product [Trichobilharzia regenti]
MRRADCPSSLVVEVFTAEAEVRIWFEPTSRDYCMVCFSSSSVSEPYPSK